MSWLDDAQRGQAESRARFVNALLGHPEQQPEPEQHDTDTTLSTTVDSDDEGAVADTHEQPDLFMAALLRGTTTPLEAAPPDDY